MRSGINKFTKFSRRLIREDLFLVGTLVPIFISMGLLLSTVKAPNELFKFEEKKLKSRQISKIKVKESPREEVVKIEASKSLTESLSAPSSLTGDLKSLSAGVVSESSSGDGGMNISQGNSSGGALVQDTGGENRVARAIQVVNPVYPQSAQARGIEGFVILEMAISERGLVMEANVISSKPQGLFDQVAIEAVKKWTFEPGIENGKTVVSRIKQKVNFELN